MHLGRRWLGPSRDDMSISCPQDTSAHTYSVPLSGVVTLTRVRNLDQRHVMTRATVAAAHMQQNTLDQGSRQRLA